MKRNNIIHNVFMKYANHNSQLLCEGFIKMMTNLSKKIDILHSTNHDHYLALFLLIDKNSVNFITHYQFEYWWNSTNKFSYILGVNAHKIITILGFYNKYKSDSNTITLEAFSQLIQELNHTTVKELIVEKTFDSIDLNDDGLVGFYELCKWINWFEIYF